MPKPLDSVIRLLQHARENAHKECLRIDTALAALGSVSGNVSAAGSRGHRMSASARKRIAAAQRARWARWKAAKRQGKKAA